MLTAQGSRVGNRPVDFLVIPNILINNQLAAISPINAATCTN
jgi:hypothetical protein